jgi:mannose-6-phosphate isomerase-like protein (cupin superfamily)
MKMAGAVRRIVTGHDSEGRSIVQEDGPPARAVKLGGESGTTFHEIWNTRSTPAPIDRASGEPPEARISLLPPPGGTRIRILDIPPDDGSVAALPRAAVRALFEAIGAGHALAEDPPHPLMHRTETVDYGIVLEGELVLILDEAETIVRAGDIVVQRGTSHAWANRSSANARIAFILIDGRFEAGLGGCGPASR